MHDQLFEHQRRLDDQALARYGEAAGADPTRVAEDLALALTCTCSQ